jgi:hypothetical protein
MPVDFDAEKLLRVLHRHSVSFVVIGGYAAYVQGSPLLTEDVDLVPEPAPGNWARLSAALTELDTKVRTRDGAFEFSHDADSLAAGQIWNLTTKYGDLDITQTPSGTFGYADLSKDARSIKLGRVRVQIASLQDIVRSKEAAGRDKDRRALPILRELVARELRERSGRPAR